MAQVNITVLCHFTQSVPMKPASRRVFAINHESWTNRESLLDGHFQCEYKLCVVCVLVFCCVCVVIVCVCSVVLLSMVCVSDVVGDNTRVDCRAKHA